jgi:hypothetical protein
LQWWINGKELTEQEFIKRTQNKSSCNGYKVYIKAFGKLIEVVYMTSSEIDANEYMKSYPEVGVIEINNGVIFLAKC